MALWRMTIFQECTSRSQTNLPKSQEWEAPIRTYTKMFLTLLMLLTSMMILTFMQTLKTLSTWTTMLPIQ
jgi:hypothetical protein